MAWHSARLQSMLPAPRSSSRSSSPSSVPSSIVTISDTSWSGSSRWLTGTGTWPATRRSSAG